MSKSAAVLSIFAFLHRADCDATGAMPQPGYVNGPSPREPILKDWLTQGDGDARTDMYNAIKNQLSEILGITKDALHVHIGLAIFLGVALVFRRSLASWIPWLALLAFEIANELMDILYWNGRAIGFDLGDSPKDIVNTMFWPTVVFLVARWMKRRAAGADAAPDHA
jgi:hypothetical protein